MQDRADERFVHAAFVELFCQNVVHGRAALAQNLFAARIQNVRGQNPAKKPLGHGAAGFFGFFASDQNAFFGAAVVLVDDHVLGNIHEAAGEIPGVSGAERRVTHAFAGTVRGNKVFQNGQTFLKTVAHRQFNDVAGRVDHKAFHAGHLRDLGKRASGAG